jgi:hypothetical protein
MGTETRRNYSQGVAVLAVLALTSSCARTVSREAGTLAYAEQGSALEEKPSTRQRSHMRSSALGIELSLAIQELRALERSAAPDDRHLAEVVSRVNLLVQLYSTRTEQSLQSVLDQYGLQPPEEHARSLKRPATPEVP